uniref:Uncharacterized protein n=1 Tax=Ditylenchus dipsaci TaxID=166011 RepID=A0A915E567_9BILA
MGFAKLFFISLCILAVNKSTKADPSSQSSSEENTSNSTIANKKFGRSLHRLLLPSRPALEEVGVSFLDALIKAGQITLAKGAFKTQLDTLKKIHPDQYRKYKDIPLDRLAADAVIQQTQTAKRHPGSGNRLIDIPKQMESSDPMEQVGKAILEKFQKQILPGLVANIIAGKNPLKMFGQKAKNMQFGASKEEGQQSSDDPNKSYEEN